MAAHLPRSLRLTLSPLLTSRLVQGLDHNLLLSVSADAPGLGHGLQLAVWLARKRRSRLSTTAPVLAVVVAIAVAVAVAARAGAAVGAAGCDCHLRHRDGHLGNVVGGGGGRTGNRLLRRRHGYVNWGAVRAAAVLLVRCRVAAAIVAVALEALVARVSGAFVPGANVDVALAAAREALAVFVTAAVVVPTAFTAALATAFAAPDVARAPTDVASSIIVPSRVIAVLARPVVAVFAAANEVSHGAVFVNADFYIQKVGEISRT